MDALRRIAITLWVGSLLFVGVLMAWWMQMNRAFAISVAHNLFSAQALIAVICGGLVLIALFWKTGAKNFNTMPFWLVVLMWLCAWAFWLGIGTLLSRLGVHAGFANWHGISMLIYLVECVLGVLLILK